MKKFELVIPAYNEGKNISVLIDRVIDGARAFGMDERSFTLILVENGSSDNSFEIASEHIKRKNLSDWVSLLKIEKNRGYGNGIMHGLRGSNADIIGWTHADLQADPFNAFLGYKILESQLGRQCVVKGVRLGRGFLERLVSRVFEILAWLILGLRYYEINAQPKVFSRYLLEKMKNPPDTFALDLYLLYTAQKHDHEVLFFSVFFPPRIHGVSKWAHSLWSRYKTILGMIGYMFRLLKSEGRA